MGTEAAPPPRRIESVVLSNLLGDSEYTRRVIAVIQPEYFDDAGERALFTLVERFYQKYKAPPTMEAMSVLLSESTDIGELSLKSALEMLPSLCHFTERPSPEWLISATEQFCQDKALYLAIRESIKIASDETTQQKLSKTAIPALITKALSVSLESRVGHSLVEDVRARWEFYTREDEKVPFDLAYLNKITRGGVSKKTLNVILAGTNVGKTAFMTHCAAANMLSGKKVLYITLEMSEEHIAQRIDANILNIDIGEFASMSWDMYSRKMANVTATCTGDVRIEEFPSAGAGVQHFRRLLVDLKTKQNFKPDIIYVDYIGLMSSVEYRNKGDASSYEYYNAVSAELRSLAIEEEVPIVTGAQLNRAGFGSSSPGLDDVSDSFGISYNSDFIISMVTSTELSQLGQVIVRQLKNRYDDKLKGSQFVIGVDYSRMKFFDVDEAAQEAMGAMCGTQEPKKGKKSADKPGFENTRFGSRMGAEKRMSNLKAAFDDF